MRTDDIVIKHPFIVFAFPSIFVQIFEGHLKLSVIFVVTSVVKVNRAHKHLDWCQFTKQSDIRRKNIHVQKLHYQYS